MTFGSLLRALIEAKTTVPRFRRQIGISPQFLHSIMNDEAPMPLKRISCFSKILCDSTAAEERFTLAAQSTHAPPQLRREFIRLRPDVFRVKAGVVGSSRRLQRRGPPKVRR